MVALITNGTRRRYFRAAMPESTVNTPTAVTQGLMLGSCTTS